MPADITHLGLATVFQTLLFIMAEHKVVRAGPSPSPSICGSSFLMKDPPPDCHCGCGHLGVCGDPPKNGGKCVIFLNGFRVRSSMAVDWRCVSKTGEGLHSLCCMVDT